MMVRIKKILKKKRPKNVDGIDQPVQDAQSVHGH